MKRICFLIGDINHSGGTERVTTLISNELALTKNKIFILSVSGGLQPFFKLNENIEIKSLFSKKVSMKVNLIKTILKLRYFLIGNKIDTLIVVDSISCVFTVPACVGIKVNHICWEHFNLKVNLGSMYRTLGRWMAARWCDNIITLTNRDKSFWDERFNQKNKTIAISNPTPFYSKNNVPSLEYKTILCVGRLTDQKGFDLLIPAWAKIVDQVVGWKITIVGIGEDEKKLKEITKNYNLCDSVEFVGQQKNMDQFYRSSSFFCMSSRFEGLPMVLLEAQSYSLPIVSFDCDTGPAELIKHNKNGFLVESGNISSLSESILKMINLSEKEFDSYCVKTSDISKLYHPSEIIKRWIDLIG